MFDKAFASKDGLDSQCRLCKAKREMKGYYKNYIQDKVCQYCTTPFQTRAGNQRFCTEKCQILAYKPSEQIAKNMRTSSLKYRLKDYALTVEDYEFELENQNYVCAICGQPETEKFRGTLRRLSVDHNHETGCYRGLLCGRCNKAIGMFQDDLDLIKKAIQYLQRNLRNDNT